MLSVNFFKFWLEISYAKFWHKTFIWIDLKASWLEPKVFRTDLGILLFYLILLYFGRKNGHDTEQTNGLALKSAPATGGEWQDFRHFDINWLEAAKDLIQEPPSTWTSIKNFSIFSRPVNERLSKTRDPSFKLRWKIIKAAMRLYWLEKKAIKEELYVHTRSNLDADPD